MIAGLAIAFSIAATPLLEIPLSGPAASPASEISSLTWHEDRLLLVPENIRRGIYFIPKSDLLQCIDGKTAEAIEPQSLEIDPGEALERIPSLDGIEAAACQGNEIYLVAESRQGCAMEAYLLRGTIDPEALRITLSKSLPVAIGFATQLCNLSAETIVATSAGLLIVDEANGKNIAAQSMARLFAPDLGTPRQLPMPTLEYRVTDATSVDASNRFWVINYLWPPERNLLRVDDTDAADGQPVEQLIELEVRETEISRTESAPIDLRNGRPKTDEAHNWEGLARLDDRGFVVITDTFPRTVFAFIPFAGE